MVENYRHCCCFQPEILYVYLPELVLQWFLAIWHHLRNFVLLRLILLLSVSGRSFVQFCVLYRLWACMGEVLRLVVGIGLNVMQDICAGAAVRNDDFDVVCWSLRRCYRIVVGQSCHCKHLVLEQFCCCCWNQIFDVPEPGHNCLPQDVL